MGGEGAMAAANASLKNNRGQMSKIKNRKALEGSYTHIELKDFPKATPEQLLEIKQRIKRENRISKIKNISVFLVLFFVLITTFLYLMQ